MAWFQALSEHTLEPGEQAFLAALEGEGGIRGALPLVRRRDGTLRGLTAPYTTRFGPAARSASDAFALGAMMGKLTSSRLDLEALENNAIDRAFLAGLRRSHLVTAGYRHFANWHENIESFEDYWSCRPQRLRHTVRRKSNKLAEAKLELLSTPAELAGGLACYSEVYAQSGKIPEPHPGFIPAMVERLGRQGQVRLGLLRLGDQAIAAQLWLVQGSSATIFKLAHRAEFSASSPGTVLTYRMLSFLIPGLGLTRVDFGRGDDMYKRDWLGSRLYRKGIIACNPESLGGLRNIVTAILPTWSAALLRGRNSVWGLSPNRASCISIADSGRTSRATASITNSSFRC